MALALRRLRSSIACVFQAPPCSPTYTERVFLSHTAGQLSPDSLPSPALRGESVLPDTELVRVVVTAGTAGTVTAGEAERAMPPRVAGPFIALAPAVTAVCPHALPPLHLSRLQRHTTVLVQQ